MIRWSPVHGHICVLSLETSPEAHLVTVETYIGGELARSESAPAYKLRAALTGPRYKLTPEILEGACLDAETCETVATLRPLLFPSSPTSLKLVPKPTHAQEVLAKALENVQHRVNRGLDLEKALEDVSDLYGVSQSELETEFQTLYA